jgi:hypothetical protein
MLNIILSFKRAAVLYEALKAEYKRKCRKKEVGAVQSVHGQQQQDFSGAHIPLYSSTVWY